MKKEIMVKVCSKCGIVNAERAEECEACGTGLDAAVTSREAHKLSKKINKRNEKIRKAIADEKFSAPAEEPVNIPVTAAHKVFGVIGCLTAVCDVVFTVLSVRHLPDFSYELILSALSILMLLAIAVLLCFLPGEMWSLRHCFYWMHYKEMPKPSDTGIKLQLVAAVILILIGIAAIVLQTLAVFGLL